MSFEIKDRFDGRTIINNPELIDTVLEVHRNFDEQCDAFHDKIIAMGVKAYRCNDGWVDRENHNITFFTDDRHKGYYWGSLNLQNGDKIFIGNASDGGVFAVIDQIVRIGLNSATYHYNLIQNKPKEMPSRLKRLFQKLLGKSE